MAFRRFDDRNPARVQDTVTSPESSHEDMSGKQDGMSHREVSGSRETRAAAIISYPTPSGPGDRTGGGISIATIGLDDKRHFDREVVTAAEAPSPTVESFNGWLPLSAFPAEAGLPAQVQESAAYSYESAPESSTWEWVEQILDSVSHRDKIHFVADNTYSSRDHQVADVARRCMNGAFGLAAERIGGVPPGATDDAAQRAEDHRKLIRHARSRLREARWRADALDTTYGPATDVELQTRAVVAFTGSIYHALRQQSEQLWDDLGRSLMDMWVEAEQQPDEESSEDEAESPGQQSLTPPIDLGFGAEPHVYGEQDTNLAWARTQQATFQAEPDADGSGTLQPGDRSGNWGLADLPWRYGPGPDVAPESSEGHSDIHARLSWMEGHFWETQGTQAWPTARSPFSDSPWPCLLQWQTIDWIGHVIETLSTRPKGQGQPQYTYNVTSDDLAGVAGKSFLDGVARAEGRIRQKRPGWQVSDVDFRVSPQHAQRILWSADQEAAWIDMTGKPESVAAQLTRAVIVLGGAVAETLAPGLDNELFKEVADALGQACIQSSGS